MSNTRNKNEQAHKNHKWDKLRDRGFNTLGLEAIIKPSGDFEVCTRDGSLISVPGHIPSKRMLRAVVRHCGADGMDFGLST